MEATAAVLNAPSTPFAIETVQVSDPKEGEILVQIKATGICHTDLVLATGALGTGFPCILGHEGAGIVEKVGAGVTKVAPGDKVLLSFNSCGTCPSCEAGEPAYCHNFLPMNMMCTRGDGSSRVEKDGAAIHDNCFGQSSFAGYSIANERNIVKLSANADLVTLAPIGCGVQTGAGAVLRSLKAKKGEALVIIGGGAVGLSAVIGGKIAQCDPIILIEPQETRRALGAELGATHLVDPAAGDLLEAIRAIVPTGADLIVETSGAKPPTDASVNMIAPRGRIGLVGVPGALDAVLPLPLVQFITMGGVVRGVVEGDSDIDTFLPELIAHYDAGRLPIDKFIKTYPVSQINQAIDDAHRGKCIKAVLTFD